MITSQKNKGSILVFTLLILSFILITAFSVASVALIERRGAGASVNSTTAFQNADKGMEDFLQQMYKDMEQSEKFSAMGTRLNTILDDKDEYNCKPGTAGGVPAYLGSENTKYIIYAYKEGENVAADNSGWSSVSPIIDCDTPLADVARFKITGNHNNAVRAVFVKLRDSLTRDLIAHWSFEDRAQIEVLNTEDDVFSVVAQDASKNSHTLTLCNFEDSVEIKDKSDSVLGKIVEFPSSGTKVCAINSGDFMIPKYRKDSCVPADNCDKDGAWTDGIVTETDGDAGAPDSEALYFDGNDFLAMYVDTDCKDGAKTEFNCTLKSKDKLLPKDGITISVWFKPDGVTNSHLISRIDGNNKGFQMYIESNKLCMKLEGKKTCTTANITNGDWHHAVGRWENAGDKKIGLVVDGVSRFDEQLTVDISDIDDKVLFIGKKDNTSGYFKGIIDDVRIWDRKLSNEEVSRLCEKSQVGVSPTEKVSCLP